MKKLLLLCTIAGLLSGLVIPASAADYSFSTAPDPDYYKSTCYESCYDSAYSYGGLNEIDFDIPELKFGLSQTFLETSLSNPYLSRDTHYGLAHADTDPVSAAYPAVEYGTAAESAGAPITVTYTPEVTVSQLERKDGSIGTVSIARVGLKASVYEGATTESMSKGAGHFESTGCWTGNIGLFGHNRGSHPYFAELKDVTVGDTVVYETSQGTRTYEVRFVGTIAYTYHSYLNEMGDNRITLITCIANQPSLRLCVQAEEIH